MKQVNEVRCWLTFETDEYRVQTILYFWEGKLQIEYHTKFLDMFYICFEMMHFFMCES